MRNLWKCVFGLSVIGIGLGASTSAQAANAAGPYYATPSWDQKLPADTRFIVLTNWNSEAVLDRETGLVWEQSPSTSTSNWFGAVFRCMDLHAGGRLGWRLPTMQELLSLVDRSVSFPGPTLPSGHPFTNVQPSSPFYWSATTISSATGNTAAAWGVNFNVGGVAGFNKTGSTILAWCVRGGQGLDAQ